MTTRSYNWPGVGSTGSNLNFADFDAGSPARGASMWQSCPIQAILADPFLGTIYRNDFQSFNKATEEWILTQATAGTGVAGVLANGVATLNAGAVTDGQGPQIQLAGVDYFPAAGKHLWFETRLKASHITGDFFFGLAELDTTIVASSDMTTSNHIGWSSFTGDGILLADANKATVRVVTLAAHTLVAATYVRLGFVINGVTSITWYVNGVASATTYLTANIPVVGLTPSFTVHATGTDQAVVDIDYLQVVQLR